MQATSRGGRDGAHRRGGGGAVAARRAPAFAPWIRSQCGEVAACRSNRRRKRRFADAGPDRAFARRAGGSGVLAAARARGAFRSSASLELASWFLEGRHHRHHRNERKDHDHGADRPHSAARAASRARWAAISARRPPRWWRLRARISGTCWSFRAFNWKRSRRFARDIGGVPERDAGSSGSPPHLRELRRGEGAPVRNTTRRRFRGAERRRSDLRELRRSGRRRRTVWFSSTREVPGAFLENGAIHARMDSR